MSVSVLVSVLVAVWCSSYLQTSFMLMARNRPSRTSVIATLTNVLHLLAMMTLGRLVGVSRLGEGGNTEAVDGTDSDRLLPWNGDVGDDKISVPFIDSVSDVYKVNWASVRQLTVIVLFVVC